MSTYTREELGLPATHMEDGTPLIWLCTDCAVSACNDDYSHACAPTPAQVAELGLISLYSSGGVEDDGPFTCECCEGNIYTAPVLFAPEEEPKQLLSLVEYIDPIAVRARESYEDSVSALKAALKDGDFSEIGYHSRAVASCAGDLEALEGLIALEQRHGTAVAQEAIDRHAARREDDSLSFLSRSILRAQGVDIHALKVA